MKWRRCDSPSIRPRARRSPTNWRCRSYGVTIDALLEVRKHVADADVDVFALGEDVGVAVRAAVAVEHRQRVGLRRAQRRDRRLLHHVEREPRRGPPGVHPEPPRDHAVDAVGGDHHRRAQFAAVARAQRHAVGVLPRLGDGGRRQQLRAGLDAPATPAGDRTRCGGSASPSGRRSASRNTSPDGPSRYRLETGWVGIRRSGSGSHGKRVSTRVLMPPPHGFCRGSA